MYNHLSDIKEMIYERNNQETESAQKEHIKTIILDRNNEKIEKFKTVNELPSSTKDGGGGISHTLSYDLKCFKTSHLC